MIRRFRSPASWAILCATLACAPLVACRSSANGAMGPDVPPSMAAERNDSVESASDAPSAAPRPAPESENKPVVVQVRTPDSDAANARPKANDDAGATHASHAAAPTQPGVMPNRDRHGNADVERYIASLQRAERVRDLKVDVVLEKLDLPSDAVIGDLGCGPGVFTIPFARRSPEGTVYASDIEPRQLDVVREKLRATNLRNIVPVLASEDDPHFPAGQLDLVFVADTYHHLEDRAKYFERVAKALKPGGRLVVLDYKPGELPVGPPAAHKPAAGVRAKELTQAGWKLVDSFDTHPYQDFEVWRRLQPWEKK